MQTKINILMQKSIYMQNQFILQKSIYICKNQFINAKPIYIANINLYMQKNQFINAKITLYVLGTNMALVTIK